MCCGRRVHQGWVSGLSGLGKPHPLCVRAGLGLGKSHPVVCGQVYQAFPGLLGKPHPLLCSRV